MSDIQYDPSCRDCRRDAGKDNAGTTWQCCPHVARERDEARAEIERLREDLAMARDAYAEQKRQADEAWEKYQDECKVSEHAERERDEARASETRQYDQAIEATGRMLRAENERDEARAAQVRAEAELAGIEDYPLLQQNADLRAEIERLRQKVGDLRIISNVNGDWNLRFAAAHALLTDVASCGVCGGADTDQFIWLKMPVTTWDAIETWVADHPKGGA